MLIIFGEKDDCYDYNPTNILRFFEKYVPKAKIKILPRADHVYLNEEEAFAQTVLDFARTFK